MEQGTGIRRLGHSHPLIQSTKCPLASLTLFLHSLTVSVTGLHRRRKPAPRVPPTLARDPLEAAPDPKHLSSKQRELVPGIEGDWVALKR